MSETNPIQARLAEMRAAAPNGADAEAALRGLSVFLTQRLGWPAVMLVMPRDSNIQAQRDIMDTLVEWQFIRRRSGRTYQIAPQVIDVLQPSPSDEEQHFAFYAARILQKKGAALSKKVFALYLDLIDWALRHTPDLGFAFGEYIAPKYGGPDLRLYERLYQEAQRLDRPDKQARILYKLAQMAARQQAIDLAAERYQQVLSLIEPDTMPEMGFLYIRTLEALGHMAKAEARWAEAQRLYEQALHVWERIKPDSPAPMNLLLWLCRVAHKQGDQTAHLYYGQRVIAHPAPFYYGYYLQYAATLEPMKRRDFYATVERESWSHRHILWIWGLFEYEQGQRKAGCMLCRMALLHMETDLNQPIKRQNTNAEKHNALMELYWQYLEELRASLIRMGCDE